MANDSIGPKARAQGPKAQGQARAKGQGPDLGQSQGLVKARPRHQKIYPPQNIRFLS